MSPGIMRRVEELCCKGSPVDKTGVTKVRWFGEPS